MASFTGWPPRSKLHLYLRGKRLSNCFDDGRIDLADTISGDFMLNQRTVEMRLSTQSTRWERWDERAIALMEDNIRYDIGFDGYRGVIKRLSGVGQLCSTEMRWKLIVRRMDC